MGKEFLGRGWKFPVELDAGDRVVYEKEETKIQESILIILHHRGAGELGAAHRRFARGRAR
jgi:hypothetical protein